MSTALITGAGKGLGAALAQTFAEKGFDLIRHTSRNTPLPDVGCSQNLSKTLDQIIGDISSSIVIEELRCVALKHGVDVLINNAGMYTSMPFKKMDYNQIRRMLDVNLLSPILLTRALWPILSKMQGVVVNISSLAATIGGDGESIYGASKAGLTGFSKSLQFDATKDKVKVLDIYLGAMQTDMTRGRKDWKKLINPYDVAEIVFTACSCNRFNSLRTTGLTIARRNY